MANNLRQAFDDFMTKQTLGMRLAYRLAVAEIRLEHVSKWMREHEPQALDAILSETKDIDLTQKLEFQKKLGEIVRDVGGNLEL